MSSEAEVNVMGSDSPRNVQLSSLAGVIYSFIKMTRENAFSEAAVHFPPTTASTAFIRISNLTMTKARGTVETM